MLVMVLGLEFKGELYEYLFLGVNSLRVEILSYQVIKYFVRSGKVRIWISYNGKYGVDI